MRSFTVRRSFKVRAWLITLLVLSALLLAGLAVTAYFGQINWPGILGGGGAVVLLGIFFLFFVYPRSKRDRTAVYDGSNLVLRGTLRDRTVDVKKILGIVVSKGQLLRKGVLVIFGFMPWNKEFLELDDPEAFISALIEDHPELKEKTVRR